MQATAATDENLQAVNDLGPLAWVLDELRKSLDSATKAMRRFVRDAELARGSELESLDASQLRIARQQLHQAVGALEMVGLSAPAKVLRAMEELAQKFVQRPELCSDDAASKVERASFALTEYLEGVLKGKPVSSVALFPQYRDVLEQVGSDRIHPADLWAFEGRWVDAPLPLASQAAPLAYEATVRARADQAVLKFVKRGEPGAAGVLREISLGFAAAQSKLEPRVFWKVSAAFFEALSLKLCPADIYAKRAASRVLLQYTTMARGESMPSDRLVQDLLFFCAQAVPAKPGDAPILHAVRQAYGLSNQQPVNYETPQFGRFDPALLVQARKRIAAATETWSSLAGGDANRLRAAADQFSLVCDSIVKLNPESEALARALTRAVDSTVRSARPPATPVAMEVATAVLYLEAAYEDMDLIESQMAERSVRLAKRLDHVTEGGAPEPLEGWMEDLYRKVSDHQTMGSVVDELRITMGAIEASLDKYFRNPEDTVPLHEVPSQLAQMRGVFSVLGLDQAALATLRMRDTVEKFLLREPGADRDSNTAFEKLGNSLGALGFLIDMLGYQRTLAKNLFVYDEVLGEFRPLMGREKTATAEHLPMDAAPQASPAMELPALDGAAEAEPVSRPSAPEVVPVQQQADNPEGDEDDAELREIFLDEAREVVSNGLEAVGQLELTPSDLGEQTTLRRAFHTLKGSSRMVALNAFGEAAWAMEQLLNTRLAEQLPASGEMLSLSSRALKGFGRWVEDIAQGTDAHWDAQAFRDAADSLRVDNVLKALVLPGDEELAAESAEVPLEEALLETADEVAEEPAEELVSTDSAEATPDVAEPVAELGAEAPVLEAPELPGEARTLNEPMAEVIPGQELQPDDTPPSLDDIDFEDYLAAAPVKPDEGRVDEVVSALGTDLPEIELPEIELSMAEPEADSNPMSSNEAHVAEEAEVEEDLPQPTEDLSFIEIDLDGIAPEEELAGSPMESIEATDSERDEQIKVIGSLRISIPLYNVYLNEADEWSRRLLTELTEWGMELHRPVFESTVALAHSLAGSSSTVGFSALSKIARALEHALQHVHLNAHVNPDHVDVFIRAAEDIRHLLHQFAAGFLKEPDEAVLDALKAILALQFTASPGDEKLVDEGGQHAAYAWPVAANEEAAAPVQSISANDDGIDVRDTIDDDLFPIFEEEALELLPQLGSSLRKWTEQPGDLTARVEALRVLHTLKGSARLAGAMRLGEMAHHMESEIEQLGTQFLQASQLEPLMTRFDALQTIFDELRASPATPLVGMGLDADEAVESAPAASAAPVAVNNTVMAFPAGGEMPGGGTRAVPRQTPGQSVRVRAQLLDRLVNQAGEVMITRSRLDARLGQMDSSLNDLTVNLDRLRNHLRDIEVQAESQMQSRMALAKDSAQGFDPLEFDRFTRVQELTRMMAESVNDVATVQRNLQRTMEGTEDDLIAQGRQARELQRDLLRTRMVEFESISERLYGVVRQASKDSGKLVKLDITGGSLDIDRGVLDRMTPAFEHLLRNAIAHGIESPVTREEAGKPPAGMITISLHQESNDVSVVFSDDGAGLNLKRIRDKAWANGLVPAGRQLSDAQVADLIFTPGFSTAAEVTELSGRGIGMDVVRSEVNALGGRIETSTEAGKGTRFKLVLPLTTAVTQVVMLRSGGLTMGVPANVVEIVRRFTVAELEQAYASGTVESAGERIPFFWAGALLQSSPQSLEMHARTVPVVIFRSAGQRVAAHVDEVLGNQEVVVKNLGPQLSRLPGLTGMSVLASGAVVLVYNLVALASVYGEKARELRLAAAEMNASSGTAGAVAPSLSAVVNQLPLVLVVDDSITVRRVTQRLLRREGYRVVTASDGLQALERLQEEKPSLVLSDIEMPRMDGFDLTRNIRADEKLRDLPIIMITSRIAEKHREHARELGVNHYLGKPYSEDELMQLVQRYCSAEVEA